MLCRGYDLHLHYANFGIRHLWIRLPHGLPDARAAEAYFDGESLHFKKDKDGPGGILCIEPFHEPGDLEDIWDPSRLIDRLVPLRAELLEGDLRPLYLAHLAVANDGNHDPEEIEEAPVPAGLDKLTDSQKALMDLYGLDDSLILAAAQNSPRAPARTDFRNQYAQWIERQPEATRKAWLVQLMADPDSSVRSDMLFEFRKSHSASTWPTVITRRTVAALQTAAEEVRRVSEREAAVKAARDRAKKLAAMAADPTPTLNETKRLVKQRSENAYIQIAALLADLRTALAATDRAALAEEQARTLREQNPTLNHLVSALRKQGFLKK
jgi:hypothetical protein